MGRYIQTKNVFCYLAALIMPTIWQTVIHEIDPIFRVCVCV